MKFRIKTFSCFGLALFLVCSYTASADLIASDSFSTSDGAYVSSVPVGDSENHANTIGTTGFTGMTWQYRTALVRPTSAVSLNHSLITGTALAGAVESRVDNGTWNSRRAFENRTTGSNYYMSALLSLRGNDNVLGTNGNYAIGVNTDIVSYQEWDISSGMYLGFTSDESQNHYLAAFAGGNVYQLSDALTSEQSAQTHMIVLGVDIGGEGQDAFTAWIAMEGEQQFTEKLFVPDIDIASNDERFQLVIQHKASEKPNNWLAADEFRFGSTFQSVAVPEPLTFSMICIGAIFTRSYKRKYR
jgi:hypothetical protein